MMVWHVARCLPWLAEEVDNMPTIPCLAYPITIGTGPHLRLSYTSGSGGGSEDVSLAAGTYYILGDGTSADLLAAVDTALDSAPSSTGNVVQYTTSQLINIIFTSSKTVETLTFLTTQLLARDLGFANDDTTSSVTAGPGPTGKEIIEGTYRPQSVWCPSTQDFSDLIYRRDAAITQTAGSGAGVDDVYTGHSISTHSIPQVFGALMTEQIVADSGHVANVASLAVSDTNATLEHWLVKYSALLGGARPTLKWQPDTSTRATHRNVMIGNARLVGGVEGWIATTNMAPLFHDLEFELIVV